MKDFGIEYIGGEDSEYSLQRFTICLTNQDAFVTLLLTTFPGCVMVAHKTLDLAVGVRVLPGKSAPSSIG